MVVFLCIGLGVTSYFATLIVMEYISAVREEREDDSNEDN